MKRCHRCENLKSIGDFHSYNRSSDGLRSECKRCFNAYTRENLQKLQNQTLKSADRKGKPWERWEVEFALDYSRSATEIAKLIGRTRDGVVRARSYYGGVR